MHASNVSSKLFEQLNFRAERQKVISSNIANINTPNYKTKELVFEFIGGLAFDGIKPNGKVIEDAELVIFENRKIE